ncbi:hypothetical protein [Quadrisphaera sp. INWT6]|uniref:hypothetical protein n=1 Tax=Quadrisphaera sp. INWT6 TaxID=2596917 RepID=UPI0018920954|nr:hypothetical protein [Quadrisphaera sp. INWT6]MBF5083763.1 hypothetical protein [Quadrisphaera sp. INWT6]
MGGQVGVLVTAREHRAHRRHCRQLLQQVPLPEQFCLEDFCEQVSEHRKRPLYLLPAPPEMLEEDEACGGWLATSTEDIVFVRLNASPLHREHIVLHELGHMLCDHEPNQTPRARLLEHYFPNAGSQVVAFMLTRTMFDTPREVEAEIYASMVGARIRERSDTVPTFQAFLPSGPTQPPSPALQALSQMFGLPQPGTS